MLIIVISTVSRSYSSSGVKIMVIVIRVINSGIRIVGFNSSGSDNVDW